jgi:hypothetical protein
MSETTPPTRVSHAEVLQTCFKALEGLGLPPGLDYDAAANVAWLESRGLGGISILAAELVRLGEDLMWTLPEVDDDGRTTSIKSGNSSGVMLAPNAVDWAATGRSVQVVDCAAPMLVMAEAARRSMNGLALTVSWGIERGKSSAKCGGGVASLSLDIRTARARSDVTIRAGKPPSAKDGRRLAGFHAQSLRDGVAVDPTVWSEIKKAARSVLVPASEQSRSGAGAEVDDSL